MMQKFDFLAVKSKPLETRKDASFIYRSENVAHGLTKLGAEVTYREYSDISALYEGQYAIFHRPEFSLKFSRLVKRLRKKKITIIMDVDDLIFDPELSGASPAVINGILPQHKIRKRFMKHARALEAADGITVSTECLAQHVRRLFPGTSVLVTPNTVHYRWYGLPDTLSEESVDEFRSTSHEKIILYSPGTRSHNKDFQVVVPALEEFLHVHPQITLRITGPLEHDLRARNGQIIHVPRLPFIQYASSIRDGWINIAPLQATPFNQCKSAIKVVEAAFWNIPTVCTPVDDVLQLTDAGAIPAETPEDWFKAFEAMLDANAYRKKAEGLRSRIMYRLDLEEIAKELLQFAGNCKS